MTSRTKGCKTKLNPPPRDQECKSWVPFSKAKLMERDEISNRQRLFTAQIAVNHGLLLPFQLFNLNPFNDTIFMTLNYDDIILGIIEKWNESVLLKWSGVQNRNDILQSIKWEGKKGYFHRARNYIDQFKNKVSDKLLVPVFEQLMLKIDDISMNQYPHNHSLQQSFKSCLLYSCFYSLFIAELSFFQCTAKPLIISTALGKNGKIRRYLASIDDKMSIADWIEEETENNCSNTKVCQRVQLRCIAYIKSTLRVKFREFHSMISRSNMMRIDFDAFKVLVAFDKQKKAKQYPEFDAAPIISSRDFDVGFYSKMSKPKKKKSKRRKSVVMKNDNSDNDENEPKTECIAVGSVSETFVHHTMDRMNHNHNGASREFQRVNRYEISRRINEERRNIRRSHSVEDNIEQIRQSIHQRHHNDNSMYMVRGGMDSLCQVPYYGQPSQPSLLVLAQRENEALKQEYRYLLKELKSLDEQCMIPAPYGVGYESPLSSLGNIVSNHGVHMNCSASMGNGVCLNSQQDQRVFDDPLMEW